VVLLEDAAASLFLNDNAKKAAEAEGLRAGGGSDVVLWLNVVANLGLGSQFVRDYVILSVLYILDHMLLVSVYLVSS
jgi:hypothetical protein